MSTQTNTAEHERTVHEPLLSLSQAVRLPWMPRRHNGQPLHVATIFRWALHGIGGTKLWTVKAGRTRCTSERALRAFFDQGSGSSGSAPRVSSSRARERAAALATERSREILGRSNRTSGKCASEQEAT